MNEWVVVEGDSWLCVTITIFFHNEIDEINLKSLPSKIAFLFCVLFAWPKRILYL